VLLRSLVRLKLKAFNAAVAAAVVYPGTYLSEQALNVAHKLAAASLCASYGTRIITASWQ
jgi:hypothetical protein